MDMWMEPELLIPGVQHGEEANFRAEVSRMASDFEKCFRTGAEQQIVDDFLILQGQWRELRWKCEDHMDVARREKFSLPCGDPPFPGSGLTLRAVPVSAGVVRDGGTMPAAGALIEMTAECGGAAARNGQQHFDVLPAEPLAVSFDEGSSCAADEIGHLEGRPAHLFVPLFVFQLQRVQRTRSRMEVTFGEMEVDGGLFQIAMTQQDLNGAQIRACFEQMSGEAVAQDVWVYSLFDACSLGRLLAGIARCFRIDRLAATVPAVAWKEPDAGFSRQATPVLAQFFEQS